MELNNEGGSMLGRVIRNGLSEKMIFYKNAQISSIVTEYLKLFH